MRRRGTRPLAVGLLVALFLLAFAVTTRVDPAAGIGAAAGRHLSVVPTGAGATAPALSMAPLVTAATLEVYAPPARNLPAVSLRPAAPISNLIVKVTSARTITSGPGRGPAVGVLPTSSRWITNPLYAWVMAVGKSGRYGKVTVPWSPTHRVGWIDMRGLARTRTRYEVVASISRRTLSVYRAGRRMFTASMTVGTPSSPTPPGRYFVTDRSPWNPSSSFGSFIFGLSGVQTNLPSGWGGGNLLAIHGTNNPSSIGHAASAGCLRVSRATLERLERVLVLGAPVIIQR